MSLALGFLRHVPCHSLRVPNRRASAPAQKKSRAGLNGIGDQNAGLAQIDVRMAHDTGGKLHDASIVDARFAYGDQLIEFGSEETICTL